MVECPECLELVEELFMYEGKAMCFFCAEQHSELEDE